MYGGEIMAAASAGAFEKLDIFEKINHTKTPLEQSFEGRMVVVATSNFCMLALP